MGLNNNGVKNNYLHGVLKHVSGLTIQSTFNYQSFYLRITLSFNMHLGVSPRLFSQLN